MMTNPHRRSDRRSSLAGNPISETSSDLEKTNEVTKPAIEPRSPSTRISRAPVNYAGDGGGERSAVEEAEQGEQPPSPHVPPHPGPIAPRRRSRLPGMGLLSALSYTLHGMMDVDPETARRNSITKTRETISQACLGTSSSHIRCFE
jgi:hypothetical protein